MKGNGGRKRLYYTCPKCNTSLWAFTTAGLDKAEAVHDCKPLASLGSQQIGSPALSLDPPPKAESSKVESSEPFTFELPPELTASLSRLGESLQVQAEAFKALVSQQQALASEQAALKGQIASILAAQVAPVQAVSAQVMPDNGAPPKRAGLLEGIMAALPLLQGAPQPQAGIGGAMQQIVEFSRLFNDFAVSLTNPRLDDYSRGMRDSSEIFTRVFRTGGDVEEAAKYMRAEAEKKLVKPILTPGGTPGGANGAGT